MEGDKTMKKQRLLAAILSLCMLITETPMTTLAAETTGVTPVDETVIEVQEIAVERDSVIDDTSLITDDVMIDEDKADDAIITEGNDQSTNSVAADNATTISTAADLIAIGDTSGDYILAADIDMTGYTTWTPIGSTNGTSYSGIFDGNGHTITFGDVSGTDFEYYGLFGYVKNSTIKDLNVVINVTGGKTVGCIAGRTDNTNIIACSSSGNITGSGDVGGLVGYFYNSLIQNCYSKTNVTGTGSNSGDGVGGLVGEQYAYGSQSRITTSYVAGKIEKPNNGGGIGGIVGTQGSWNSGSYPVVACFFDAEKTGTSDTCKGFGVTTSELQNTGTLIGWDFTNIWGIDSSKNGGYPYLKVGTYQKFNLSGTGKNDNPYIVTSAEELAAIARGEIGNDNFTACYKLANDIELTGNYWTPIGGNGMNNFSGTFDGDGHTISGVKINYSGYEYEGLFGVVSGTIKNLDVVADIQNGLTVGALAGRTEGATISSCSSSGEVKGSYDVGGLIGYFYNSAIQNSYSVADVTGTGTGSGDGVGGLVGEQYAYGNKCKIITSYTAGRVKSNSNASGGIVGTQGSWNSGQNIILDSYFSAGTGQSDIKRGFSVNRQSMKKQSTFTYWDFENVWGINSSINSGYPYLTRVKEYENVKFNGLGTSISPYIIEDEYQLAAVARGENGLKNYSSFYKLANDIEITTDNWTPIGGNGSDAFSGNFDGAGHKISGLKIDYAGYEYEGLFGEVTGTIKNVEVSVSIGEGVTVGSLAGYTDNAVITSCSSNGNLTGSSDVGGLIGYLHNSTVQNCYSRTNVTCTSTDSGSGAGGLVGEQYAYGNSCKIVTSYAAGKVTKANTSGTGGVTGVLGSWNSGRNIVCDSYSDVDVTTISNLYCGFDVHTEVMKDRTTYTYWDFVNVWGIDPAINDGYPYLTFKKEYSTIEPEGTGTERDPYIITNEYELAALARHETSFDAYYVLDGDIYISSDYWTPIGGNGNYAFSGHFDGCGYSVIGVNIAKTGYEYKGLFGEVTGTVENVRVSGEISDSATAGLLIGYLNTNGVVKNCASLGSVRGSSDIGGLIGYFYNGTISDCYSRANVISTSTDSGAGAGGLIGEAYAYGRELSLSNLYATGEITKASASGIGGLVGTVGSWNSGKVGITNSFFDNISSTSTDKGTYVSTEDMKKQSTYTGWDFDSTWSITSTKNDGYPQLQLFPDDISSVIAVKGVSLNKTTLKLAIDNEETLTALIDPAKATNPKVTWKSSDNTVATVTSEGKVKGIAAGTATITVTTEDGNKTAKCVVTVSDSTSTGTTAIALNKPSLSLAVGKDETLTVTFTPTDTTDKEIKWSSSDTTTATVNNSGKVTAVKAGTATITVALVSDDTIKAECVVTVTEEEVTATGIKLNKNTTSIEKGADETLTVSFLPEGASSVDLVWSSDKQSIATVSASGKVTGVSAGTAVITVKSKDGKLSDTCTVTVTDSSTPGPGPEPEPVPSETYDVRFFVGDSEVSKVTVQSGDSIFDVMPDSSDIQAMLPDGAVYAGWYIDGTSTLWDITSPVTRKLDLEARYVISDDDDASTEQGSGRDPGLIKVVSATYYYDVYMVSGQSYTFPVTYGDIDSTSEKKAEKINWISSDPATIKISGKYKAKALKVNGNNEVFVSDKNSVEDSDYVYVIHIVSPSLGLEGQVLPKSISMVKGETSQFTIDGIADELESFYDISWYSSNAEIARVDDGLVTAMGKGSAKISAYVNGKVYTASVKVTDFKNPDKVKNASDIKLTLLQTASLKFNVSGFKAKGIIWTDETDTPLKAYDKSGLEVSAGDKKVSYYQNDVVRVTPTGKVTAVGIGNTTLTATDPNSKTVELTIDVPEPAESIIYVNKGKSKNLIYYNVNKKNAIFNYGSNESINLIDLDRKKGKVTGVSAGKAVVTCEADPYNTGNKIVYKTVIYVEDPVIDTADSKWSNKKPLSATLNLKKGEKFVIKVNGTWQPVVFTSNKNAIAFIDEAGVVEARSKGNATLSTRVNGAKLTVKVVVTE